MYKNVLQNIENIAIWPVISFVIFFLFFLILMWWFFTIDKHYANMMGNKPLEDSNLDSIDQTSNL